MNILVIAPTPYFSDRGCHIRILEEAKALQVLGHKPVIYTYHLGRTPSEIPVVRSAPVRSYTKTSAGPAWFKIILDGLLLWKILRTTQRGQFDVIHAHLHEGGTIGIIARWWLKCPLVIDLQSELVNELQIYGWAKHTAKLVYAFERWLMRRANWIAVSSDAAANALRALAPDRADNMTLLRDGVGAIAVANLKSPAAGLGQRSTIVYAGGMGPAKGFDQLLEVLGELKRRQLEFKMRCIGQASVTQQQHAAHLGLHSFITWQTAVPYEQLHGTLSTATIGIDPKPPTSTEGSGKLLNYMAAGLAVVAYDSPTTRALVGEAGVLVSTSDTNAFADALASLLMNETERLRLSQAAQRRVQQQFLWNELIKPLVQVYVRLVQTQ